MNLRRLILFLYVILVFAHANAEIATWAIRPDYHDLKRVSDRLFLFQDNDKWGIINSDNIIILPASNDFITPWVNGYALAGMKEGSRYLLKKIIEDNGRVININEICYLPGNYQYFSQDKLAISNKNGKYGYINPEGEIVVRCQFDNALPFKEGYAPVRQGDYMKFIRDNYDQNASRNTLAVDFHDGDITAAGCFSNGLAPVAYNTDYALIDENGQKVRKIKDLEFNKICKSNNTAPANNASEFYVSSSYSEYVENGKFGLKKGDKVIVKPQFDSFGDMYSDGNIIATVNGKKGLLHINDGELSVKTRVDGVDTSELEMNRNGVLQPITIDCNIPIKLSDYHILVDDGRGQLIDRSSEFEQNGNSLFATIIPSIANNNDIGYIRVLIENEGIVLTEKTKSFSIIYPVMLAVTLSCPSESRANESDQAGATITAKITNDSSKDREVDVVWSTGKKGKLTVPSHGTVNSSIHITENNVMTEYTKTFSVKLDSGEKATCKIKFIPFF